MIITIAKLEDLTTKAIAGFGYDDEGIAAIREILLYAQLRGNNQGVVKLIGKGFLKSPTTGEIVIEKETPLSARIDGNRNHAMVVMHKGTGDPHGKVGERIRYRGDLQYQYLLWSHRLCSF